MSELSKKVNSFFKEATKSEMTNIKNEMILDEHLEKVLVMFYIEHKDINFIAYTLGYSKTKISEDLKLIRKKLSKLI